MPATAVKNAIIETRHIQHSMTPTVSEERKTWTVGQNRTVAKNMNAEKSHLNSADWDKV